MSWAEAQWIVDNLKSGVKSVQRGVSNGAQTITINEVNFDKAYVISYSKGSAGTVAATGALSATTAQNTLNLTQGERWNFQGSGYNNVNVSSSEGTRTTYTGTMPSLSISGNLTGGTTNLTAKQFSARLTSPTTLVCDGTCEWQVIDNY